MLREAGTPQDTSWLQRPFPYQPPRRKERTRSFLGGRGCYTPVFLPSRMQTERSRNHHLRQGPSSDRRFIASLPGDDRQRAGQAVPQRGSALPLRSRPRYAQTGQGERGRPRGLREGGRLSCPCPPHPAAGEAHGLEDASGRGRRFAAAPRGE